LADADVGRLPRIRFARRPFALPKTRVSAVALGRGLDAYQFAIPVCAACLALNNANESADNLRIVLRQTGYSID